MNTLASAPSSLNEIPLGHLKPSKTNPRDDFESPGVLAYLEELAETIRKPDGVLQPILVRPEYCVGLGSREAIEKARPPCGWQSVTLKTPRFEIIAGECRWRASEMASRLTIPSIVREMTDDDAQEAQQIENLKRRGLTPMQESKGIARMLALKNDRGEQRYTVDTLAAKLGFKRAWVYRRWALLGVPEAGKKAMADGSLSPTVAQLIVTVPRPEARENFTRRILKPELTEGPLSYAEAKKVRDADFVQVLKNVAFDLADASLVPAAGACTTCPKMSANCAELFEGDDNAHLKQRTCMDPVCYRAKVTARQKQQQAEAVKAGNTMLTGDEAAKIYPFFTDDGVMDPKSPYVQLGTKPAEHLVKKEVTKIPTWEKLVADAEVETGAKVPRVIIPDQKGVMREHVEMKLAIAAIEKAGEPIFREAGGGGGVMIGAGKSDDAFAVQKKAEAERAKVQWAVTKAALDAVWAALLKGWDSAPVWEELFYVAMQHAGDGGLGVLAKWRDLPVKDGDFARSDAVEIWRNKLTVAERDALVPLLLVSANMKAAGAGAEDFKSFARALKVDLGAIEKKAVADFKAKEKGARLSPAELEAKVREMMREKKPVMTIAVSLGLALKKAGRIWDKITKENAAAKAVSDPKILAQWVKARAGGMSIEEIARSYKVEVADVKGALQARDGFMESPKKAPKAKAAKKRNVRDEQRA